MICNPQECLESGICMLFQKGTFTHWSLFDGMGLFCLRLGLFCLLVKEFPVLGGAFFSLINVGSGSHCLFSIPFFFRSHTFTHSSNARFGTTDYSITEVFLPYITWGVFFTALSHPISGCDESHDKQLVDSREFDDWLMCWSYILQ